MAWTRTKAATAAEPERPRKSLVASAMSMRLDNTGYNSWRFNDETWQRELWRLYDIIPEFGFAARWVGQCCSRVRIYVARVDELGRIQGEVKKPKIAALSDSLFGGPASKAEALRSMGIDLTVAGECYILGRPSDSGGRDEWYILSSTELRRIRGSNGEWDWGWCGPGEPLKIDVNKNVITRVWTPHPQRIWCADSPSRSCQPVLRELEQLTKYIFSQMDSRLAGGGLLLMPNQDDFPAEENTTAGESLMKRMAEVMGASLRGEGTAMGLMPLIVESSAPDAWRHMNFETELSKQAMDLRKEAIERLGVGMDMPPEVLSGTGQANHWSGYLVDGQGIKVHIEPLMGRICDALTRSYLKPALEIMGEDPEGYTYYFDTSPLVIRPQRLQDALNLYEKQIVSKEAVREAGFFKSSDKPEDEEVAQRLLQEVLLRDPQLLQNQKVREGAGIPESVIPQSSMIAPTAQSLSLGGGTGGGSGPPPPLPPPTGLDEEVGTSIPMTPLNPSAPPSLARQADGPGERPPPGGTGAPLGRPPTGLQASAFTAQEMGVVVMAEATVRRAMEVAGKKLLTKDNRHRWPDVPAQELHTRIRVGDQARANRLLLGAWDQLEYMTEFVAGAGRIDVEQLRNSLHTYCSRLLLNQGRHEPSQLLASLQADGVVSA